MKQKKSISNPKLGMNRDASIGDLKSTEISFVLNGNTNNESADGYNIQNEPSNRLGVVFPQGFKTIRFEVDFLNNRTYYFLTNPTTGVSSIGYVLNTIPEIYNDDTETACDDCSEYNALGASLEDVVQTPSLTYYEILNDSCHINNGDLGLNFNINFPIKFGQLKYNNGDTLYYWDDYRNPPRWINLTDTAYLFVQDVPCLDDIILTCFDVDRLLEFPKYTLMQITPDLIQTGGQLKLGTYEFYAAYCDILGNEITQYCTPTNPIKVFDRNNYVLEQTELDSKTNYAIKLKVDRLDTDFKYYKVVVAQRTNVGNTQSYFVEGIHPTTDNIIVYSSEDNKPRISQDVLYAVKPRIARAKGLEEVDNKLVHFGIETKREVNLQPVANFMGAYLKWQSSIAKEDIYKSPIATSKYASYPRNEVQPFAIRFNFKDEGYTANFPLIARPPTQYELDILTGDLNQESIEAYMPNCADSERNRRWQFYNTATLDDEGCVDLNSGFATEIIETVTKTCQINPVATIASDSITINLDTEFTDLQSFIEDNPDVIIPEITPYLEDVYASEHCAPNFGNCDEEDEDCVPNCEPPTLVGSSNAIANVVNEVAIKTEANFPTDYDPINPPQYCFLYTLDTSGGTTTPLRDTSFEVLYMYAGLVMGLRTFGKVYDRDFTFTNTACASTTDIVNFDGVSPLPMYFLDYLGALTKAELQTTKSVALVDVALEFTNKIHKGALWFKGNTLGRDKFVVEVSKQNDPADDDDIITPTVNPDQKLRLTVYDKCSSTTEIYSTIFKASDGVQFTLDLTTAGSTIIDDGTTITTVAIPITTAEFQVVIDAPIVATSGRNTYSAGDDLEAGTIVSKFRTAPPDGCFSIVTRDLIYTNVVVSWDSITIIKTETYESQCTFLIPKVDDCDPIPFQKGLFSYWESTITYPDNSELYDSSNLIIDENDLSDLSNNQKTLFRSYYSDDDYTLDSRSNFTCAPLRFHKFPDNTISPFMMDTNLLDFSESYVFPLGVTLDNNVVKAFLKVALTNNLLTQEEYDNIESYEILRGNNVGHKSIVANGLAYDMYKYDEKGKEIHYANFPHNDLGTDQLHYTNSNRDTYIPHPFGGIKNNKYSFISPDLLLSKKEIPTEVILSGYQIGNSRGFFTDVEDHPKWTILGSKARKLALRLATLEVAFELLIQIGNAMSNFFIEAGFVFGLGIGAIIAAALTVVAYAAQGALKVGRYRYQWLTIFRDLGAKHNFAEYFVSEGFHNRFVKNEDTNSYLRGISTAKYLKDARRYSIRDEKTGEDVRVNSFQREYSVFLSLGDDPYCFNYNSEFINYDNSLLNLGLGSRTTSSVNDCDGAEIVKNVGSPYLTLKNYIPDQYGEVDSIKWLTTNYINKIGNSSACETIFGGTYYISRFSYKRKIPFFTKTSFKLTDRTPFNYYDYHISNPVYYCNYESDGEFNVLGVPFPDIDSNFLFDCESGTSGMYVTKPSKFFLWYYGIANFLVESEINCNFRYAKKEPVNQFYPNVGDMVEWTQEKNLSIKEPNSFFYNDVYSLPVSNTPFKYLKRTYNFTDWEKRRKRENSVLVSERDDSNGNEFVDSWLIYKPLSFFDLPVKSGTLSSLKSLGSEQLLMIYDEKVSVLGAVNSIQTSLDKTVTEVGRVENMFEKRPIDILNIGSGLSEILETPYGYFFVDEKRAKIGQYLGGNKVEIISEQIGDRPSNMRQWFKEQIPFKILQQFPNINIDNKYKGIGFNLWYDDRQKRVFFTKRDYVVKSGAINCLEYNEEIGFYDSCQAPIISCPIGYTYNEETELCEQPADCLDGFSVRVYYTDVAPYTGHTCNRARFNLRINGVDVGIVNLNNNGGTTGEQIDNGNAIPSGAIKSRETYITPTQQNLDDIALTPAGITNLTFTLECRDPAQPGGCHNDISQIDIFQNNVLVFTGDIGLAMGLDYDPCSGNTAVITTPPITTLVQPPIYFDDTEFFEDVSWTISYKPEEGLWNSYWSFYPDYSPFHKNFFQIGFNWGVHNETLWNHTMNNSSFQVFQGILEPFIVEYPIANENVGKMLNSISLNVEAKRYQSQWDFAQWKDVGFNKLTIYNNTNHSGDLVLHAQKTLSDTRKYPITNVSNNTQDILFTSTEDKQNINYFFNRIINQQNNIPMFLKDKNNIFKLTNSRAVSFKGKRVNERLKGEAFLVRLTNDTESRFNILLKNSVNDETIEQ